ncbi:LOW QUALITY PROTEIN: hypothetical protein SETIT_2G171100v2 [Setaria italica]|uniref:Uncharacterized protein n=1 Tax=Setaria italica TaxID=4555 RepID=A0A368Q012_SETIT|nr:LOW QUALITY PROTEIN: hypothetical protein SETIT_2G171100v2 [Setaria italica]
MAAGSAQSAVDSLVGRLTLALLDEAQLLSGVSGDVEFIKREMESMSGLLLDVSDASGRQHPSNQVRAWMRQVQELAYDSQSCVDRYVQNFGGASAPTGVLATLWRAPRTVLARRRIAKQIRELKARAVEVGEWRQRYGVMFPDKLPPQAGSRDGADEEADSKKAASRRRALDEAFVLLDADVPVEAALRWCLMGKQLSEPEPGSGNFLYDSGYAQVNYLLYHLANELFNMVELYEWLKGMGDGRRPNDEGNKWMSTAWLWLLNDKINTIGNMIHGKTRLLDRWIESKTWPFLNRMKWLKQNISVGTPHGRQLSPSNSQQDDHKLKLDHARETMRWMKRVFGDHHPHGQGLRVLFVLSRPAVEGGLSPRDNFSAKELGRRAYSHPLAVEKFESRVCIDANIYTQRKERLHRLLDGLLPNSPAGGADLLSLSEAELESKIQQHLRGRKFLIVLNDPHDDSAWEHIRQALPAPSDGFSDGSAVIVTPSMEHQEDRADGWITARMLFSHYPGTLPYKVYVCSLDTEALRKKVSELCDPNLAGTVSKVLMKCRSDSFSTKMVFHALHADPHRSKGEWEKLLSSLDDFSTVSNARHIIRFSYDGLPSSYKSCLLYLRIFPPDCKIRRTSLVRRWAAERLITKRGGISAIDEADHCFQELIDRRLVLPGDINPQGKAKSCTVHVPVLSFIARITGDDDPAASNSDLVPELAHHLSIRNGIQLSRMKRKATRCPGLKKQHLKNICNKIFQLKYLSLRNTDVNELPKEINKLQDLETFDIRQTKIHAFPAKAIILRKLVCLLAGRIGPQGKGAMGSGEESFSTLLSETADVDALNNVGRLQKLKKLGIVINGKQDFLDCLLQVIGKLNEVICSFSICIKDGTEITEMKSSKLPTPRSLAKLNISGKISGLSTWISELEQLSKITLSHTFLEDIDIRILGNLFNLRFLRLGSESYTDKNLTFRNGFSKLEVLVIESSHISDIHFEQKAAPKLEKIVWTSTVNCKIETLAIEKLPSLKEIELNGVCERSRVEKSVRENPKNPKLKYNTDPMCEDTSAME